MKYTPEMIVEITERNLRLARRKLAELPIHCGRVPAISGLHGWVYEQTIQFCLLKELAALRVKPEVDEQIKLGGRAKADFRLNHVLVEVKTSGLFGMSEVQKYRKYRRWAEQAGCRYLFVSAYEGYLPYRRGICDAVGRKNVFLLDQPGHWSRLVSCLAKELKSRKAQP